MTIKFVKQDCWIGLYWKHKPVFKDLFAKGKGDIFPKIETTWYLCLIPCFPIIWITYKDIE